MHSENSASLIFGKAAGRRGMDVILLDVDWASRNLEAKL